MLRFSAIAKNTYFIIFSFILQDAHTCLLNFDTDTSLFAVFDGHGGAEVAQYCAKYLPNFLKNIQEYKNGDLKSALEKAFIEFDKLLINPKVIEELKALAGIDYEQSEEEEISEAILLRKEADMPIEDLIAKYSSPQGNSDSNVSGDSGNFSSLQSSSDSVCTKPTSSDFKTKPSHLKDENILNRSSHCSSSTSVDPDASNRYEPCTSSSLAGNCPNGKVMENFPKKSGSETDSVSSSVNETVEDKNEVCKVSSTRSLGSNEADKSDNNVSESSDIVSGISSGFSTSNNSKSMNGETSQEKEGYVSTSTDASPMKKVVRTENQNDTSSTSIDEPTSSSKGKGKKKKIVTPQVDSPQTSATSVYQAFLNDLDDDSSEDQDDFKVTSDSSDEVDGKTFSFFILSYFTFHILCR